MLLENNLAMDIKWLKKVLLVSRNTFLRIYVKEIKYGKSLVAKMFIQCYLYKRTEVLLSLHIYIVFTNGTDLHVTPML